jgi:hypothetical protein
MNAIEMEMNVVIIQYELDDSDRNTAADRSVEVAVALPECHLI